MPTAVIPKREAQLRIGERELVAEPQQQRDGDRAAEAGGDDRGAGAVP